MTACTNHGGKARRVVTAALVGVLSVGTVPMVALAEGVSDAVSPMFAEGGTDGTEFADGSLELEYAAAPGGTQPTESTNVDGVKTVSAEHIPFTVTASEIELAGDPNGGIEIGADTDFKIALYKADEDGNPTGSPLSGNRITAAGGYVLTVTPLDGSEYVGQTFKQYFEVTPVQIDVDSVVENGETGDTDITFTGSALDLDIVMDGEVLVEGEDYTVKFVGEDGKTYDEVVDAGDYTAKVTGLGIYEGTTDVSGVFTVKQFDFDDAVIVAAPYEDMMDDHPVSVTNGKSGYAAASLDPSLITLYNGYSEDLTVSGPHKVSAKVDADEAAKLNISNATNVKDVTVVKVDALATFTYNGEPMADSYDFFLDKGQSFDPNAIAAVYGNTVLDTYASRKQDASGNYYFDVVSTPVSGNEYKVTVSYNLQGDPNGTTGLPVSGKVLAGSKTITVHVWDGQIDADTQLYVYGPGYNTSGAQPTAITSYDKAYDGKELEADDFLITDKTGDVTNLGGSPELTATLYDSEGNKVDSAVEAGEYTLKVTSDSYKLSGTTELKVTIHKVDLTTLEVGRIVKWNDVAGQEYLPQGAYSFNTNLSSIEDLGLVYDTGNGDDAYVYGESGTWYDFEGWDLIPDNADVAVEYNDEGTWKQVTSTKNSDGTDRNGQYRVVVTVGEDVASNYGLPEGETSVTVEFTVANKSLLFSDVQPSDWYYDAVSKALKNQYMRGYAGTTTFGAEDNLTRAQAVIVLFNMSGATFDAETDSSYDETSGWVTGFDDVDGNAYYAQAVAWAKKTGVVNGYDATHFGPEDEITREQFAAMLANYAKVVNRDETVDSADQSVLADFADANTVSDWAKGAVAWAASATEDRDAVMGNNGSLMGQNKITRGEVAAMVTNYQPNPKVVIIF